MVDSDFGDAMIIKTRNICSSVINAIAKKLKMDSKEAKDKSTSEYNVLIMCSASSSYLNYDLLHAVFSVLKAYQKQLAIDTHCKADCDYCDTELGLGVNTQLCSYNMHVGGMLYDDAYARNQHDGFCLVVDVSHTITCLCENTGSLLISVRANKVMDV